MLAWWFKIENSFQTVEKFRRRFLIYTHGAVALHVAVTTNRASTCPRFSNAAFKEKKIDNLPNVIYGIFMLGQTHRPANDDLFLVRENGSSLQNLFSFNPGFFNQFI